MAPIPPYRRSSMAGPVVLILVGVVFLLANAHVLPWERMRFLFGRWWPVLIIVWGVIKLVEYFRAKEGGYRMRGIGVGGVFLMIFIVLFGIAAHTSNNVNWGDFNGPNWDFDIGGQGYDYTDEMQPQPVKAGSTVQVSSDHGDIVISTWDEQQIKVVGHKRVTAGSQDEANRMADQSKPVISGGPESLSITANTGGSGPRAGVMGPHGVTTNLEIFLPKNVAVDLNARHGDVKVRTRDGAVRATSQHGDIDVEDVNGAATISMRHGDLRAQNVNGNMDVDGSVSDLDVSNISGPVHITAEVMGSIKFTALKKGLQFHSSRTDLNIDHLIGELNMDRGDLHMTQCDGVQVATRSKDIHLEDVTGDVRVDNTNGQVDVHASQTPLGNIRINNLRGDVEVVVPAAANFDLNATSRRGSVYSDFAGVSVNDRPGMKIGSGTVGKGGPKVEITSETGAIQIRKAG